MPHRNDLRGWYKLRWKILRRDKFICQYCGQAAPNVQLEVDHKVPLADGGTDDDSNLATACWACNRGKNGLRQSIVLTGNKRQMALGGNNEPQRQKQILGLLSSGDLSPTELANATGANYNTISVLLNRLKRRGVVTNLKKGQWTLNNVN